MKAYSRWAVVAGITLSVALVAVLARGGDAWPCSTFMYAHGDAVSGYESEAEALKAGVRQLEPMGLTKEQVAAAQVALANSEGDDRYSRIDGKLYLDGELVAQFKAGRLADGTFIVDNLRTCAPESGGRETTPGAIADP
jgi:hypothetical protein